MPPTITSSERGRELARKRHSVDTAINQIVRAWPSLTESQRSRIAQLVPPSAPDKQREAA